MESITEQIDSSNIVSRCLGAILCHDCPNCLYCNKVQIIIEAPPCPSLLTYNYHCHATLSAQISTVGCLIVAGVTYFLKGLEYWEFNDAKMHVRKDYPQLTGPRWLECEKPMPADGVSDSGSSAATYWTPLCIYLFTLSQVVLKLLHTGHS